MSRISIIIQTCLVITASFNITADEKFKVCADPLNPPYSNKNLSGFENKIAELFAKELNQTVQYTWFPQRIGFIRNTLKAKNEASGEYKCDIVMSVPYHYELTLTTRPYYHSSYVLLIAKQRGWDDIDNPRQLTELPVQRQRKLRIAMFDRGPGTTWLQQNGLLDQGIPYQTMSGDPENNTAMQIQKDLATGKIDMVILWGPMAGHVITSSPANAFKVIPMKSTPGIKFDFSMAMGVRHGDKKRQAQLNKLIVKNAKEIANIISRYQIPLLPIPEALPVKDAD